MNTREIRNRFLNYFKSHHHRVISSSPTIPHDDPTILFTNAGMNQFKPVFLGTSKLDTTRATTSQKCVRVGGKHNDLDNVGFTSRHLTFFEMLGNFSFGDYFKEEAIKFAFELSTQVFQIDPNHLWVSVYQDDDEAFELWTKHLPAKRIVRLGAKDNFWSMGDTGPCGPCTELLYDRGKNFGNASTPLEDPDGERFFEFWNLVFMQFNKDQKGIMNPLPKPCVDTGMGLERISSLLINSTTVFETDVLNAIIKKTESLCGIAYKNDKPSFHVIADHLRMLAFTIADGAIPSNLDRGYVLRKVLRRAVRYGKKLEFNAPFLTKLFPTLLEHMGDDYPELKEASSKICEVISIEEENFYKTLKRGGNILNSIIEKSEGSKQIEGEDAFKLKDTYGFPVEEIVLIAKDNELSVNLDSFMLLEEAAKERSRKAQTKHMQVAETSFYENFVKEKGEVEFIGYHDTKGRGTVIGIVVNGVFKDKLEASEEGSLILDKTTFYGEGGGQVGDFGEIFHDNALFKVSKTIKPFPGIILHTGTLESGTLLLGEPVFTSANNLHRKLTSRNHTATHLLHYALNQVLGSHVGQAGSLVDDKKLRFDFSHHKQVTLEEIRHIEDIVNEKICLSSLVDTCFTSYESVKNDKQIKQFFGDKYGSEVRVVAIGDFSKELCGGTHVENVSEISLFRITSESSIAAGVRRIEAVTGREAELYMYSQEELLSGLCKILETNPLKSKESLLSLLDELKKTKEELKKARKVITLQVKEELLANKEMILSTPVIIKEVFISKDELVPLANEIMSNFCDGVLLLALKEEGRCQLVLRVSNNLVAKGIHANKLLSEIAKHVGGQGGGKPESALAGGKDPSGINKSFEVAKTLLKEQLNPTC